MTAPDRIKVTPEVANAEAQLRGIVSVLSDKLEELRPQVANLQGTWIGREAADKYQQLQGKWDRSATDLFGPEGLLAQIAKAVGIASMNYYEAEVANARSWAPG